MTQEEQIQVYQVLLNRAKLARANGMGMQYGDNRNLYDVLGYPDTISYPEYRGKYDRLDIAAAIINRPVDDTWRGVVNVFDPDAKKAEDDKFRWAFQDLSNTLGLKGKFIRLDKLSCIGRYGVLLMGYSDVIFTEDWKTPVKKTNELKLLYVNPLSEESAVISTLDEDPKSPRYGKPKTYIINTVVDSSNEKQVSQSVTSFEVHYSRVIHVTGETLESDVYGIPVLKRVYNRLMDLEKLVGGSAEMFWRGARPGTTAEVKEGYDVTDPDKLLRDLETQIETFEHGLRRTIFADGVTLKDLQTQVSDPDKHVDVQLTMISIVTGIPKRILQGSERGELASTTDADTWYGRVQARREEYAEIQIIRPFVEECVKYGILPKPTEKYWAVEWQPLYSISAKERAEVATLQTQALVAYAGSPVASGIIPEQMFMKHFLNLPEDVVLDIENMAEQQLAELDIEEETEETPAV